MGYIPKNYLFVLDLNTMALECHKWQSSEAGFLLNDYRLVDDLERMGRRYTMKFIETPFLEQDSIYRVWLDGEVVSLPSWKDLLQYFGFRR
jgi:hypothetical protein